MSTRQMRLILTGVLVLAMALTVAVGQLSASLALEPIGESPWWFSALRLAVLAIWAFLFWFVVIWGIGWLLSLFQREKPDG